MWSANNYSSTSNGYYNIKHIFFNYVCSVLSSTSLHEDFLTRLFRRQHVKRADGTFRTTDDATEHNSLIEPLYFLSAVY